MKKIKVFFAKADKKYLLFFLITCAFISILYAQVPKWVAPAAADNLKNPYSGDSTVLKDAKALYITNCAPCHGTKGKGNGTAAEVALNVKPANHTSNTLSTESDGALFWKISEGRKPMPEYRTSLTDKQRWELVTYIRTLRTLDIIKKASKIKAS